jgi:hypothetical protein
MTPESTTTEEEPAIEEGDIVALANAAQDAAEETDEPAVIEDTPEDMAAARQQGWRPADEFNRPPEDFKSAKDFLAVSANEMPVLRNRLKKMEGDMTKMQGAIQFAAADRAAAVKDERERVTKQYEDLKRDAVESGDLPEYDRLQTAQTERFPDAPEPEPVTQQDEPAPAVSNFMETNKDWWGSNREMTRFAVSQSGMIQDDNPEWTGEQVMAATQAAMERGFPDQFGAPPPESEPEPAPRRGAAVERRGRPAPKGNGKTFGNLPADYKAGYEESVAAGLLKDGDEGKKHYAKVYYDQQEQENSNG